MEEKTTDANKILIRIVFDDKSSLILGYDNTQLIQACSEFDLNDIRWEFV